MHIRNADGGRHDTTRAGASLVGVFCTVVLSDQGGDAAYKPKRINKMIELLEAGQPVYDLSVEGAGHEEGKRLAKTHVDMIP